MTIDNILPVLREIVGNKNVKVDDNKNKTIITIYPPSSPDISKIIKFANENSLRIYVGNTFISKQKGFVLFINTKHLNKILIINEESCFVQIQAGITLEDLETGLNEKGFSLGTMPMNYKKKSIGALISRNIHLPRFHFEGIHSRLIALNAVLFNGDLIQTRVTPKSATGPDLKSIFVGSNGLYGVILNVYLKIFPLTIKSYFFGLKFSNFNKAAGVLRELFLYKEIAPTESFLIKDKKEYILHSIYCLPHTNASLARDRALEIGVNTIDMKNTELFWKNRNENFGELCLDSRFYNWKQLKDFHGNFEIVSGFSSIGGFVYKKYTGSLPHYEMGAVNSDLSSLENVLIKNLRENI
jgi:FAD/FMN-containing dehydrogenase